jgi:uncharacterized protein
VISRNSVPASIAALAAFAFSAPAHSQVVISQIYGGGGNSGATLKNDFVELFNRGTSTVDLNGFSVQYNSASSTGAWQVTTLSGFIAPGQYYLVQELAGTGGTTNLPAPDATGTIAMSATAGKLRCCRPPPRSRSVAPRLPLILCRMGPETAPLPRLVCLTQPRTNGPVQAVRTLR